MGTRIRLNTTAVEAKDVAERLEMSTAEIGLSVRTTNCLEERGIYTVNDLLNSTADDLLSISNFGEKTLEEVYKALEAIGFYRRSRRRAKSGATKPLAASATAVIGLGAHFPILREETRQPADRFPAAR